jgi:hypothetical protein
VDGPVGVSATRGSTATNMTESGEAMDAHSGITVSAQVPPRNEDAGNAMSSSMARILELFCGNTENMRVFGDRVRVAAHEFVTARRICAPTELRDLRATLAGATLPERAVDLTAYLDYLNDEIIPNSVHVSSPAFIGHMTSALPTFLQDLAGLVVGRHGGEHHCALVRTRFSPGRM